MHTLSKCPLVMVSLSMLAATSLRAQEMRERLRFEVASVKPNPSCGGPRPVAGRPSPGRVDIQCATVQTLLEDAYYVFADGVTMNPNSIEVVGGPGWRTTDTYSVSAKAPKGSTFTQMYGPMMQSLLEERFQLKVHRASRETAVYFLTVAKGGLKLAPTKDGACITIDPNNPPSLQPGQPRPPRCGTHSISRTDRGTLAMRAIGITMEILASDAQLRIFAGRPIIDHTGMSGRFDLNFEFTYEPPTSPGLGQTAVSEAGAPNPTGSSLFDAMDQLGLKLEPGKGAIDILVVDHLEKPGEN